MKKLIVLLVALLLAAGTALADVSNEVIVGLEADSIDKAKDNTGADITDKVKNDNSLFTVQYTHFFSPLKDDGKPIDLRRFYQHPSTLSAGLAVINVKEADTTSPSFPSDGTTDAGLLLLGGELYLPTNTGFFLNIGGGSGTVTETINSVSQPEVDLKLGRFEFGVRQYIGESFAIHLRLNSESMESKPGGGATTTDDKAIAYLGARWVIAEVVGLALEFGGGERELKASGASTKFDVSAVNAEIAGYFGKQFSVRFAIEAEEEDLQGMPAGIQHVKTTGRTTLGFRYWFSESFGMELPIYSEKVELKTVTPSLEFKEERTNGGIGLYAAFRF